MDPILKKLAADLAAKNAEVTKHLDAGDLTHAEQASTEADEIKAKIDARKLELEKLETIRTKAAGHAAYLSDPDFTVPVPGAGQGGGTGDGRKRFRIDTGDSEVDKYADTGGFKSFGHFAHAVRTGSNLGGRATEESSIKAIEKWAEIQIKAPSGMFEGADPDGGELVPREFSNTIYRRISQPTRLFGRVTPITVRGNALQIPRLKENSRANGSRHGGVRGYWHGTAEAQQYTSSRPTFDNLGLRLKKLIVMSYVTEELLEDSAVALDSWLMNTVPDEFDFMINDALINGSGVEQPLGIMNSGSKITVTAESGQGASTIVYKNVLKMHNRMLGSARSRAVWLINQDTEPQLEQLYLATGTAHGNPIYLPQGNGGDVDLARLKGKPVIVCEQCQTLGTEGDIIFVDFGDIACIVKGSIKSEMSMHLRFDYDERAYKWSFRMDAKPYNQTALTPFKGSNTYSQIVTLNSTRT